MPLLSLLSPLKSIFTNPYVIGAFVIVGALLYHYYTVNSLEKDLAVALMNVSTITQTNSLNVNTIGELEKEISNMKISQTTVVDSYVGEIDELKDLMANIKAKVIYKDKIVIQKEIQEKIVDGETIYITDCAPIKVHKLDVNDNNFSIQTILSGVGK